MKSFKDHLTEANKDGTISPGEDKARVDLINKAKKIRIDLEKEARELGGSFRGPGIWHSVKMALEGKSVSSDK